VCHDKKGQKDIRRELEDLQVRASHVGKTHWLVMCSSVRRDGRTGANQRRRSARFSFCRKAKARLRCGRSRHVNESMSESKENNAGYEPRGDLLARRDAVHAAASIMADSALDRRCLLRDSTSGSLPLRNRHVASGRSRHRLAGGVDPRAVHGVYYSGGTHKTRILSRKTT
jgi:hypothetical protein